MSAGEGDPDGPVGGPDKRARPPTWLALPLLLLSLLAGAATERERATAVVQPEPLRGSQASAVEVLELRVDPEGRGAVRLVGDERAGAVEVLQEPSPAPASLAPGQRFLVDLGDDAEAAAGRAACGRVVAVAPSTGRPLPALAEAEAVGAACAEVLGISFPACEPDQPCITPPIGGDPRRVAELLAALDGGSDRGGVGAAAVPPPVRRLEATVVAGDETRSAVGVRLARATAFGDEEPAVGERVTAAYPGGEVVGVTDAEGRALLPLPDVALRDALPVQVSWRGVLPTGTVLNSLPSEEEDVSLDGYEGFPGWLLGPIPYDITVLVRREAARR